MANDNGIPPITAKWPDQDVSRDTKRVRGNTVLIGGIDRLCVHHGNSHDGGVFGMVLVAGSVPLLPA